MVSGKAMKGLFWLKKPFQWLSLHIYMVIWTFTWNVTFIMKKARSFLFRHFCNVGSTTLWQRAFLHWRWVTDILVVVYFISNSIIKMIQQVLSLSVNICQWQHFYKLWILACRKAIIFMNCPPINLQKGTNYVQVGNMTILFWNIVC